jgi:hypothetical protein
MVPMRRAACRLECAALLLVFAAGCNKPSEQGTTSGGGPPEAEVEVRAAFADLQAAVKGGDADQLWGLLSGKSQADAERAAGEVRAAYVRAGAGARAQQEEALGLTGKELAKLTGPGFLKGKHFRGRYDELAAGKLARVAVERDSAAVYWDDADGEREKTTFVREGGRWRAWLSMPRGQQP